MSKLEQYMAEELKGATPGYRATAVKGDFVSPDYLIKGVLNRGDNAVTFGDSGTLKSFVELDKALRLGMGLMWCGHKVKRALTLIVLGEGAGGYRKRIRAWLKHHSLLDGDEHPWVHVIDQAAELYANPKKLSGWIKAVEAEWGVPVDHVLIDTLNTNMGEGADENNAVAIGSMFGYAKEAANGAAITYVHHVGHGDKGRERGSYAIRGNMDNRTLVERDEDGKGKVITVSSLKVKDGEEFRPVRLTFITEVIGVDEDGDSITSLVVTPTDIEPIKPRSMCGKNKPLEYVKYAIETIGSSEKELVRKQFMLTYPGTDKTRSNKWSKGWQDYMRLATKPGVNHE